MSVIEMARNSNKPWSEEDDRRLLEMRAAGRTAISIGLVFRRSAGAVEGRMTVLRAREKAKTKPTEKV
jgi:hypothetical protein